jgi:hypothetical protein
MSEVALNPDRLEALGKLINDLERAGAVYAAGDYTYPFALEFPLYVCDEAGVRIPGRITRGEDDRLVWKTGDAS